ncbi:type 1 glutamine amidotransferase [Nocardioides terrisoli]|uniref:type 1 glutamine amidotransferase n=1 Tax=Nocardioides terrisoli TaxID=3388267 RepID=UPI00287BC1DB|nr:glutamine amidotransferase [Nocardioides marmorisolisilvae]
MTTPDALDVVLVYPELLGLYGDRGNAMALAHRARARGHRVRVLRVGAGEPVPAEADIYLLGGGEDASMLVAGELLAEQHAFVRALRSGACCLAVCAGFQLLSQGYTGPDGRTHAGLGVLDVECGRLPGSRAVGEVVARPYDDRWGLITGYENHQGDARLGPDAVPLGEVFGGVGNGHAGNEGARQLGVLGTYLHGPVLARNPDLADHLLEGALGSPLGDWVDPAVERLRRERLRAADRRGLLRRLLEPCQ